MSKSNFRHSGRLNYHLDRLVFQSLEHAPGTDQPMRVRAVLLGTALTVAPAPARRGRAGRRARGSRGGRMDR